MLIICYRRYNNVLKLVKDLQLSEVTNVYLALDGNSASPDDERDFFLSNLELFCAEHNMTLEKWIRPLNLGPALSVITAIDWFFTKESFGIILEDDLEIGPSTIPFFRNSLETNFDDPSIGIISGSNFWKVQSSSRLWSGFPITWGWATWRNRWHDLRQVFFKTDTEFIKFGKLNERLFWKVGLHRCLSGRQDAWDIPFASYFRNLNLVCLFPSVNLISNVGVDAFAGNTVEDKWPLFQKIENLDQAENHLPEEGFHETGCLDSQILSQIYSVTDRNIFSALFYFGTHPFSFLRINSRSSLANRIASVEIP